MPKVLIIGPKFHYFNASVERAFCTLGYETRILAYDNPVHPYNWSNKVRYKFCKDKLQMKRESRTLWQVDADRVFVQYRPDIVFVMNGDMLLPSTIISWRKHGAKVALWFFDSMTYIPLCEDNITAVDAVFCYEQTDIPLIEKRYGVMAHFLPQAVDTTLYHSVEGSMETTNQRPLQIVFAGDMVHSCRRREIIQAVVSHYPTLKMRVWGEYKPWYKNPLKWLTRERRDIFMNRNASAEELNRDYNQASIVLNIHIEQQKDGANPKVYEISAAGAYQICDANPYLQRLFPGGEVGLYHNIEELFTRIDEALANDMSRQSGVAHQMIVSSHTFVARMRQVLAVINKE